MNFFEKENNGFISLVKYISSNRGGEYVLVFNDRRVHCKFESMYEGDNGYEIVEDEYEAYFVLEFYNTDSLRMFEVTYQNVPNEVYHNGELVFSIQDHKLN